MILFFLIVSFLWNLGKFQKKSGMALVERESIDGLVDLTV